MITPSRRPVLTIVVFAITLIVSIAAFLSPALMRAFVRNPQLRTGQWWRALTPVLVQPSGWGQLAFNLLGIVLVGAALQRHLRWPGWSLTYLSGGSGSILIYLAWHPADTGGGSSAAVAAMIGALVAFLAAGTEFDALDGLAEVYSVFFAVYLTALQLGGVLLSIIAGNAALAVTIRARHTVSRTCLTRIALGVVLAAGITMTAAKDDHGVGLLIGVAVAGVTLAHRRADFAAHCQDAHSVDERFNAPL